MDGTYANGDYIKDEFAVGENGEIRMILQMGLANNITASMAAYGGIMGIGYDTNEATSISYPNFMDEMVDNGLTNTQLYSLWLNDARSDTGSILFGGIDTDKYYDTLLSMPVQKDDNGNYSSFKVVLSSLSLTPQTGLSIPLTNLSFSSDVVLDASTTLIYLPGSLVNSIYNIFNATILDGYAYTDCKYGNSSVMSFGFQSGSVIDVAYSEFINKLLVSDPPPSNLPFTDVCLIGVLSGDA